MEFALVLPILLVLLLGILDLARAYEQWNEQTSYANTAARFVAVGKPAANAGTLPSGATLLVCVPSPSTYAIGQPVTVRVSSTYTYLPFLASKIGVGSAPVNGSATTRVEVVDSSASYPTCPPPP